MVPSLCYENSPTVITMAYSLGLPVLAADIGGIGELVHDKRLLFQPADENDLINKINWAMENARQLKKIGQDSQIDSKKFDLDTYIDKLLNILRI